MTALALQILNVLVGSHLRRNKSEQQKEQSQIALLTFLINYAFCGISLHIFVQYMNSTVRENARKCYLNN